MTKILVADDASDNRYMLVALLEGHGYEVVAVTNGAEALAQAQSSPPDLIVTDVLMPVLDGFELCRRWKQDERLKRIPFVVYTATYTDPEDERLALSLGADRFLVKPLKPGLLLGVVREVLEEVGRDPAAVRPGPGVGGEAEAQRLHAEALMRKLEKKVLQLEGEVARRNQVESALRESERRFRLLAENALDVVWSMGFDGRFTYVSPAVETLQGYSPAEVLKLPLQEVLGREALKLVGDEMASILGDLDAGRDPSGRSGLFEIEQPCKDGSTVWTEISVGAMRDEGGKAIGIQGVTRNITKRKRAEQLLRESARLLRIAGRMARLGGWSADLSNMQMVWSDVAAAIHEMPEGWSPSVEEGLGFYAPEWRARMATVFGACALDGTPYDEEMEIVTARGRRVWVRTIGEAIRDESGSIRKVQGAFQDITDRKLAEEERKRLQSQLLQSQKIESIGRLAGGVAHDFNNLLSVVLSYARFAMETVPEGDPLRADLDEIARAGERAAALTRQLLAFSRKQVLEPEVLSLNEVIAGIESMLRPLLGEDIDMELRLCEGRDGIMADPGQIDLVIMNLAVNARDAMPRGGKLIIETAHVELDGHVGGEPGRFVVLSVTDTGTGMDAATEEHIFEPFFTTKEKGKGTGLGLSTVYGIVKQSGGNISVDSEPGRGTTFKVYLPWVDAAAAATERRPALVMGTGSETVLVVEDEDGVRKIAERILRGAGYRVQTASNGEEALRLCEKHDGEIDLLLTDVVMPRMSGRELAERLARTSPKLKVLFMSGYADDAIAHGTVLGPGMRLIGKPFAAAELTRRVREALDSERPPDALSR